MNAHASKAIWAIAVCALFGWVFWVLFGHC